MVCVTLAGCYIVVTMILSSVTALTNNLWQATDGQLLPMWYGVCVAQQTVWTKCESAEPIKLGGRLPYCRQASKMPQDRNLPGAFAKLACAVACWHVTCLLPARHTSCLRSSRHVPETTICTKMVKQGTKGPGSSVTAGDGKHGDSITRGM